LFDIVAVAASCVRPLIGTDQFHHGPLQGRRRIRASSKVSVDEFPLQNRWILVEFLPLPYPTQQSAVLNSKQIYAALKQSVLVNFGDTGWGAVGSSLNGTTLAHPDGNTNGTDAVKYFSPATNICIIRVARDPYRIAWGAVTYLSLIDGWKYIPNVVHISG
jgi:ribonuclease P/MRP protein subunit POP5